MSPGSELVILQSTSAAVLRACLNLSHSPS